MHIVSYVHTNKMLIHLHKNRPVKKILLFELPEGGLEPLNLGNSRFISDFIRSRVVSLSVTMLLWLLIMSLN